MNPDLVKGPWTKEEDQKASAGRGAAHTGLAVNLNIPVPPSVFRDFSARMCL